MNILLVDDDIDVLNTLGLLLVNARPDYNITQTESGKEAIQIILDETIPIDVVVTDLNMDNINGAQLAKMINDINPLIRIILISAFDSIVNQIKYLEIGIEKSLIKPFKIEELIHIIEHPALKVEAPITQMIPVKIKSLIETPKAPVDLYIHLAEEKFVKIFNAKETIDTHRAKQFILQKIEYLYAKKEECLNLDLTFYVPVRISHFKTNRKINFNVYYLANDHYLKLIPEGSVLNQKMLDIIKNHKLMALYIIDKDQPLFLNYLDLILDEYMKNKEVPKEDMLATSAQVLEARTQEVYHHPTAENVQNLKKSQRHLIDFLKDNKGVVKDLLNINEKNKGIHVHCSMVASLSYALLLEIISMRKNEKEKAQIRALDEYIFESNDLKEIIFIGALLHDVGKIFLKIEDEASVKDHLNGKLSEVSRSHPQVGHDKLKAMNILHPKSLEIILQHEEFCDGTGYPYALKKTQLNFFSQVVILINYFDKLKRYNNLNNEKAIKEIKKTPEKFNRHLILILEKILMN